MITKRELSARRDINTIAGVFDTVKCQRDKAIDCLSWYWTYWEATTLQDTLFNKTGDIVPGKESAFDELEETYDHAWDNFERMAEEIRKEMEE